MAKNTTSSPVTTDEDQEQQRRRRNQRQRTNSASRLGGQQDDIGVAEQLSNELDRQMPDPGQAAAKALVQAAQDAKSDDPDRRRKAYRGIDAAQRLRQQMGRTTDQAMMGTETGAQPQQPQQAQQGQQAQQQPSQPMQAAQQAAQSVEGSTVTQNQQGQPQLGSTDEVIQQRRQALAQDAGINPERAERMSLEDLQGEAARARMEGAFQSAPDAELVDQAGRGGIAGRVAHQEIQRRVEQGQASPEIDAYRARGAASEMGVNARQFPQFQQQFVGSGMQQRQQQAQRQADIQQTMMENPPQIQEFGQGGLAMTGPQGTGVLRQPDPQSQTIDQGQMVIDAQGNVLARNDTDQRQTYQLGQGERIVNQQGQTIAENPAPQNQGQMSEREDAQLSYMQDQLRYMQDELGRLEQKQTEASASMSPYEQQRLEELRNQVPQIRQNVEQSLGVGSREQDQGDGQQDRAQGQGSPPSDQQQQDEYPWTDEQMTLRTGQNERMNLRDVDPSQNIRIAGQPYTVRSILNAAKAANITPREVVMRAIRESRNQGQANNGERQRNNRNQSG